MTTSKGKPKHKYKLRFMPEALEEWRNLDGSVQANLKMNRTGFRGGLLA